MNTNDTPATARVPAADMPSPVASKEAGGATALPHPATAAQQPASKLSRFLEHLRADVNPDKASFPLVWYCFMTGFVDAVSFSACFIWCAFQTGNTIQLGLAIARLFSGPVHDTHFRIADQQALVSVLTFLGGASIGRMTNMTTSSYFGPRRRAWLVLATLIMAMFSLAACLLAHASKGGDFASDRGNPAWTDACGFAALGFISASMGLQAAVGTRLGSHFATSVVLTTIWVQIVNDPNLHKLNRRMLARDSRLLAVLCLLIGGIVGRALIDTIGDSSTLAIGTGIRVIIAFCWLFVPAATPKQ